MSTKLVTKNGPTNYFLGQFNKKIKKKILGSNFFDPRLCPKTLAFWSKRYGFGRYPPLPPLQTKFTDLEGLSGILLTIDNRLWQGYVLNPKTLKGSNASDSTYQLLCDVIDIEGLTGILLTIDN